MRALLFIALVACASDDRTVDSAFDDANEIGQCEPGAWGGVTTCTVACEKDSEPEPAIPTGAVCPTAELSGTKLVEFDGLIGRCGRLQGEARVVWFPCHCEGTEKLPPCE